jgi:hypothetical protein
MAENESLDLGGAYAKRWDAPFAAIQKGASVTDVSRKFEEALGGGLRKALKQMKKDYGVSLTELLEQRQSRPALRQLLQRTYGHLYVQLFVAAAAASGPSQRECLRGWVDAILDRMFDQISHRVAGRENWPTFGDVQEFMQDVQQRLEPVVEKLVANFEKDPAWLPRRRASKDEGAVDPTEKLLSLSLLRSVP